MEYIGELSPEKIRGGFYTPPGLVDACLERVCVLLGGERSVRFLEPSAGNGAFVRGIGRLLSTRQTIEPTITCVEVIESEAALCEQEITRLGIGGEVVQDSFFAWINQKQRIFDALIGNPPFIRYQFVPPEDRSLAEFMLRLKGFELQGVSNYWIPFVILGLELLRVGAVFAIVLPAEIFSCLSRFSGRGPDVQVSSEGGSVMFGGPTI